MGPPTGLPGFATFSDYPSLRRPSAIFVWKPPPPPARNRDLTLWGDLHVGRLEVEVDDALLVGGFESLGDLAADLKGLSTGSGPL